MLPDDVASDVRLDRSALVFIDMQRRHLDTEVGYHTLPSARAASVVEQGAAILADARRAGLRVVHVGTWSRAPSRWGQVDGGNPFMRWQNGKPVPGADFVRQAGKCVEGSVWAEFMPGVEPAHDEPLVLKKRYSAFYVTDLERILRNLGVETIFLAGVNTNNCVLATTFDAHARDFRVVLLEEATGSMNGDAYHKSALMQIEAALGFVASVEDLRAMLRAGGTAAA